MNLQNLEHYEAEMDRRGYKWATRERKTYVIKSWFEFLHRLGVLDSNVAQQLIPPRPQERGSRFLSKEEYQRLLRFCSRVSIVVHQKIVSQFEAVTSGNLLRKRNDVGMYDGQSIE